MTLTAIEKRARDHARDEIAARRLGAHLDAAQLPALSYGEPAGLAGIYAAAREAPEFLRELGDIYGIRRWTQPSFRERFIEGALKVWHGDLHVMTERGGVHVVSSSCPLAASAAQDARVCQMCRAFQKELTQLALPGDAGDIVFDRLITKGDSHCSMHVSLAED